LWLLEFNKILKWTNFGYAYLLSSVNVNLTKSFCILSTNELLKYHNNNNNKNYNNKLKSREGKDLNVGQEF